MKLGESNNIKKQTRQATRVENDTKPEKTLKRTFLSLNRYWFRNIGAGGNNKDVKENRTIQRTSDEEDGGRTTKRKWHAD